MNDASDSANDSIIASILDSLTPEQKQALVDQVTGQTKQPQQKNEGVKDEPQKPTKKVNEDFTVTRDLTQKAREPVRSKKNKWKDEGEDKEISTPMFERTPRARKAHKMETVECHVCGKEFKVDPKYVYGSFHRCNRCGGR
jgi:predicted HNH restriction endonuclease